MLRAARLLADNMIVSITAGDWEGVRVLDVPIGQAVLGLSSGAPGLAHLTGAALLPIFGIRRAPGAAIDVIVERPIEPDRNVTRAAWVESAMREFADRLTPMIERHPEQWRDWNRLTLPETPPNAASLDTDIRGGG
jgi:hypothetical protein